MLDYDSLAHDYAEHRAVNPQVLRALYDALPNGVDLTGRAVGCGTDRKSTPLYTTNTAV